MLFDLRLRTSPLVLASDASATGLGVCRTSSLEPKGLLALAALQQGHNFRGEEIGLIEVGTTLRGVRQAFARLKIKPGAYAIVGAKNECKRIILQTWPDVIVSDACTGLTDTEVKDLINRASRSGKWLVAGANRPAFGQQQASSRKSLRPSTEPCQNTDLVRNPKQPQQHNASVRERAVPDETDCVPVDRRIVCQTDFFWGILEDQSKRSRKNYTRR